MEALVVAVVEVVMLIHLLDRDWETTELDPQVPGVSLVPLFPPEPTVIG